jgi:predicted nucleic acid-binding protein
MELGVSHLPLRPDAPVRLARLRADSGLKLPDCCVLLAAKDSTAEAIATFDDRLINVARDLGFELMAG